VEKLNLTQGEMIKIITDFTRLNL